MINNNTIYFYCTLHTTKSQSATGESIKKRTNKQSQHNKKDKEERYFKFLFKRTLSRRGADGLSL